MSRVKVGYGREGCLYPVSQLWVLLVERGTYVRNDYGVREAVNTFGADFGDTVLAVNEVVISHLFAPIAITESFSDCHVTPFASVGDEAVSEAVTYSWQVSYTSPLNAYMSIMWSARYNDSANQ